MAEEGIEAFGFRPDDFDSLPPAQRERALRAWEAYRAQEPLAEVTVRVFKLARGGSEVQFKTQAPEGVSWAGWYEHVARVVADEVTDAAERSVRHDIRGEARQKPLQGRYTAADSEIFVETAWR